MLESFKMGRSYLEKASPLGLILTVAALTYVLTPSIKNLAKSNASFVKDLGEDIKEQAETLNQSFKRSRWRNVAVITVAGVIDVTDRLTRLGTNIKDGTNSIVEEARERLEDSKTQASSIIEEAKENITEFSQEISDENSAVNSEIKDFNNEE